MESQLSKSERKRRARDIELLVLELAALPEREIGMIPCDPEIQDEIHAAKDLKGGAKKRQLKYVTKLLRQKSVDDLFDFMARHKGSRLKSKREFQNLEHLRDLLIDEVIQRYEENILHSRYIEEHDPIDFSWQSEALAVISNQLPGVDQEQLKNIAIQFARTRNRKFSRELFRILKGASEKIQYTQTKDRKNGIQER